MQAPDASTPDAGLLFAAVREAGDLAMALLRQPVKRWTKDDGSPVTEADLKVDALLAARLAASRPLYGWLSEETADDPARLSREACWVVDPIDGTRAFADGGTGWCIAAALVLGGRPALAAVYRPATGDFYSASAGGGAWLNGSRLAIADSTAMQAARMIGTRKSLAGLMPLGIAPDHSGELSLQLRLALVAEGRAEGAVSIGPKHDWDLAAGDLLVHEAGGRASDLAGERFIYNRKETWQNGMVAAAPSRHTIILRSLERA